MGKRIFFAYRRRLGSTDAARIDAALEGAYPGQVVRSGDLVDGGGNVIAAITRALKRTGVVVVLVEPGWLDASMGSGFDGTTILLTKAEDLGIPVIPLLAEGAEMPDRDKLPGTLVYLGDLHPLPLDDDDDFDLVMERLVNRIAGTPVGRANDPTVVAERRAFPILVITLVVTGLGFIGIVTAATAFAMGMSDLPKMPDLFPFLLPAEEPVAPENANDDEVAEREAPAPVQPTPPAVPPAPAPPAAAPTRAAPDTTADQEAPEPPSPAGCEATPWVVETQQALSRASDVVPVEHGLCAHSRSGSRHLVVAHFEGAFELGAIVSAMRSKGYGVEGSVGGCSTRLSRGSDSALSVVRSFESLQTTALVAATESGVVFQLDFDPKGFPRKKQWKGFCEETAQIANQARP